MTKDIRLKIGALLVLFAGEFFSIYGEMIASKTGWHNVNLLIKPSLIIIIAGILLMLGYLLCYMQFKNIRIVTVISITSIFIIEPILARLFFHEMPTRGAIIGFIFGMLGMLSTIFL